MKRALIGLIWYCLALQQAFSQQVDSWRTVGRAQFRAAVDGTLALDLPLAKFVIGDHELEIPVTLTHRLVVNPSGTSESQFYIPQFLTYIIPVGETKWRWCKPGGKIVDIDLEPKSNVYIKDNYSFKYLGGSSWMIIVGNGNVYNYEGCHLKSVELPSGTVLEVACQGGLISRIDQIGDASGGLHLKIDYRQGLPTRISVNTQYELSFVYDSANPNLLSCLVASNGNTRFSFKYDNGLLTLAELGSEGNLAFEWDYNRDFGRGNQPYRPPVFLKKDSEWRYDFRIEDIWTIVDATSTNGTRKRAVFNRLTGSVR